MFAARNTRVKCLNGARTAALSLPPSIAPGSSVGIARTANLYRASRLKAGAFSASGDAGLHDQYQQCVSNKSSHDVFH
jgi:hypothetical protein